MSEAKDDIHVAVRRFISRFGPEAPREAALRAAELASAGDIEGSAMWHSIEVEAMRILRPSPPKHLH